MIISMRGKCLIAAAACVAGGSLWAGVGQAAPLAGRAAGTTRTGSGVSRAQLFAAVAPPVSGPFGASLEGAAFSSKGQFYFVNATAPAGQPKLLTLNLTTRQATGLYTDSASVLNCIGFAPDGTLYVCDLKGRIARYDPATRQLANVLTSVGGTRFYPNDIAVSSSGDMYISDYQGTPTDPAGRILLRLASGTSEVALSGLAHPNGIVLTPDQAALWVDEDLSGTLDHVAQQLSSPASATPAATLHTASYLSLGANAYADSLTVDGAGNIYMAVYGGAEVLEFSPDGTQVGRVVFPASAPKVTHVAIEPGTRNAFVTTAGPDGGYIYTFQALAAAPAGQPNGG
jgi:lactonase